MRPNLFNSRAISKSLLCLACLALFTSRASSQEYDPDWLRNFRAGPFIGLNIKANFSMSGNFTVGGNPPGVYDDGYVRVDDTGNAGGLTSFWGYDNADQLSGSTLTMHQTTSFTTSGGQTSPSDSPYIGLDLAYGGVIYRKNRLRVGWEFGFGMLPMKITDRQGMTASVDRDIFTFDTGGIVMPPPGYEGGSSGVGPLIDANPNFIGTETLDNIAVSGSRTLDVNLYTLKLGPTLYWDVTPYIGLSVGAGAAVGIMSGDFKFDETLSFDGGSQTQNRGEISGTDVTYGGYVNATLTFHTVKNGDFYLGVQYIPLGNTSISGQGRRAELELGGQIYISAGINWPF
jgi:hypothetical protein